MILGEPDELLGESGGALPAGNIEGKELLVAELLLEEVPETFKSNIWNGRMDIRSPKCAHQLRTRYLPKPRSENLIWNSKTKPNSSTCEKKRQPLIKELLGNIRIGFDGQWRHLRELQELSVKTGYVTIKIQIHRDLSTNQNLNSNQSLDLRALPLTSSKP
nr:hypothetical protein CR513_53037 [Ipomoea batatas]GME19355.1 hypothetical protein CR513_53037 [Ipomoea batatas]